MNICQLDSTQKIVQFTVRMIILSCALISTLFVGITCLKSNKQKYWVFKLLILQSFAESIDLIGAISLSFQSKCYETLCHYIGYIMHCCWLTSFSCLLLLFYLYHSALHINSKYQAVTNNINKFMILCTIWPYLWLLYPLLNDSIGPTGWKLYNSTELFYLFCGFEEDEIIFLIFWSIPLWLIFLSVLILRKKVSNQKFNRLVLESKPSFLKNKQVALNQTSQRKWQIFRLSMYSSGQPISVLNIYCRTPNSIQQIELPQQYNYFMRDTLNPCLHTSCLCSLIIACIFYKNYNQVIDIKAIWSFGKKNSKVKSDEQLI